MMLESQMLIATLLQLFMQGVTALPLHDSCLTAGSEAAVTEAAMRANFTKLTGGFEAKITISVS